MNQLLMFNWTENLTSNCYCLVALKDPLVRALPWSQHFEGSQEFHHWAFSDVVLKSKALTTHEPFTRFHQWKKRNSSLHFRVQSLPEALYSCNCIEKEEQAAQVPLDSSRTCFCYRCFPASFLAFIDITTYA